MILRARLVVPVGSPPIADGVVSVSGQRVRWVGSRRDLPDSSGSGPEVDLGESILMPGLVNAHCHLDYTDLAGLIAPPKGFTDWIQAMVGCKAAWTVEQYGESWRRGAAMLLRSGTTTVLDVEAVPELQPSAWSSTPLRVVSFRELIHFKKRVPPAEFVERAVNDWLGLPEARGRVGLSPHAPYTTSVELLERAARAAHRRRWRLMTHVAESEQEFELFMYRHGPMYDWLKSQRDLSDCGHGTPVEHLERCGYLEENVIAVHVNYLGHHDAGILSRSGVSVVHCPRSHDYFRHLKFAFHDLAGVGVNVCLGTDSLATVRLEGKGAVELDLFAEMRAFARREPGVTAETIVRMATMNGARALGRAGELGEIKPDARADLIALPFSGPAREVNEAVVHHTGPVRASMIDGVWAIAPEGTPGESPNSTE
jgi:cytosine/adenosine deaminase-related metal-dependent hydrolase